MDLILCHTTADFDTLGSAVGCARLQPGSRIVLTGGTHPAVRDFLALHRDEYPLIERRSVNPATIRSITVVDTQRRDRIGKAAEWLDLPNVHVILYDHHLGAESDIATTDAPHIEPVGATTTLIVEALRAQGMQLNPVEATAMALGIHVDTGSLTFEHTTVRDTLALAWLMEQGASLRAIADYVDPGLSPKLQELLRLALDQVHLEQVQGHSVSWVLLDTHTFVSGLSSLTTQLMDLTESDALILGAQYSRGDSGSGSESAAPILTIIARTRIPGTDLNVLLQPWGGGGHPRAATATLKGGEPSSTFAQVWQQFLGQIPQPVTAHDLMSSPVRTIRPQTTIDEAQRVLLRYGHSGLSVVDADGQLVGIISRRDIDIALHHGFSHAPVKGYMTTHLKTITPETSLPEIESIMVTYDVGRLPVVESGSLVGIVTRTDVLRQLHQFRVSSQLDELAQGASSQPQRLPAVLAPELLQQYLTSPLWMLLMAIAQTASERGWQLYIVGGAVRDLLISMGQGLNRSSPAPPIQDLDLVVDGCYGQLERDRGSADTSYPLSQPAQGAGVQLAEALRQRYPNARLQVHGRFQTAALLWHQDPVFGSLWIDIATARTEFYPYPAANPEVEASSLKQDLYRRDFTINALALKLTSPHVGEVIDFFGGWFDLQAKQVRVLHANSFIEDPTRIYRAVRFAVRLGFQIDAQTEGYIRYAIASGVYDRIQLELSRAPALQTRLKTELKYILQAPYWQSALKQLADLDALHCIHPALMLDRELWRQLRLLAQVLRYLPTPQPSDAFAAIPPPWQLRLELMIASLMPDQRVQIAQNLQLPDDSIQNLQHLAEDESIIRSALLSHPTPSQITTRLAPYSIPTLIYALVRCDNRHIRQLIWCYLTQWLYVASPLDGNDLRQSGYKPGPQFKTILSALRAAYLDGHITDRVSALAFLAKQFPQT
jgi:tRNA nucleotidyltransferase (CCA-adding enzyme)